MRMDACAPVLVHTDQCHTNMFEFIAVCVCVCVCFHIMLYVNCFGRTVLDMCMEYHIWVNMCCVSTQGVDEHMINVHYYCC